MPLVAPAGDSTLLARVVSAARSVGFLLTYGIFTLFIFDLGTRLIVRPAVSLYPQRRRRIVGAWLQFLANATLGMARVLAGVRVVRTGCFPEESCVVLMNHQSLLDVPLAVSNSHGAQVVIPTRDRYQRWIPGVSPIGRLAGFPYLSQARRATKTELKSLLAAAADCANGETTLVVYPEGHRSKDGSIGPFMTSGLELILSRVDRPVYLLVSDGMWHARTLADMFLRAAGSHIALAAIGPFTRAPDEPVPSFIDRLRAAMVSILADQRRAA